MTQEDNETFKNIVDVQKTFLECLQDQVKAEKGKIYHTELVPSNMDPDLGPYYMEAKIMSFYYKSTCSVGI